MIFGIGIDIIEIERIKSVFENKGDKYLHKIFTEDELAYSFRFKNPYTHLAARFSAKEAFYKSIGFGILHFHEIEVYNEPSGKPRIKLHGETLERWKTLDCPDIHISLTHTNIAASAVVVLENNK